MAGHGLLAIVPARGGSKGLHRKNARVLAGTPLIGWTAEAFRRAAIRDAVCILSTDDKEIAAVGTSVGLNVPFMRPQELATDEATAEAVALHALDWFEREHGEPDALLWLQPTSPFREPSAIVEAVDLLSDKEVDAVLGVKPIHRNPATLFRAGAKMDLIPLTGAEALKNRRQDVEPLYTPNGALYLIRTRVLRETETFFPPRTRGLPMDQIPSFDIDHPSDWQVAEALAAAGLAWLH